MTMKLLLSILGLLYAFCPIDLLPDFVLGWGWIDDLLILGLLWFYYYRKGGLNFSRFFQTGGRADGRKNRKAPPYEEANRTGYNYREEEAPRDAYSVLGVSRNASPEEIRRVYRELVNKYHPDKVVHLGEEFRDMAEKRFKEIQQAYQEIRPQ